MRRGRLQIFPFVPAGLNPRKCLDTVLLDCVIGLTFPEREIFAFRPFARRRSIGARNPERPNFACVFSCSYLQFSRGEHVLLTSGVECRSQDPVQ